ncbi:major facilitator superfamily transporter [Truncatella angustata]|uniref:Major facilitator superfamily transporter n=1 Tax=Truncatella angustata TaxID=152316 RepID=A0A9P8UHI5_9PEZI|nr:major facilitator superfamily transporter [Truncatella angustata]KAH6652300.1 major facilitator superfamily transporter [Truncatella angustata]
MVAPSNTTTDHDPSPTASKAEGTQMLQVTANDPSRPGEGLFLSSRSASSVSINTAEKKPDPILVTWEGPDDPTNPKNWSKREKWTISLIVSAFAFLSPLSSSIAAPALDDIGNDLHIPHGSSALPMVMSIFLLTYALGPFVLSPCSEVWGRTRIIKIGNIMFILSTALCGWAQSEAQILAFRFLAGIGGSATMGMGSGILADCWRSEERGKGLAVYQLAPVLGPAIGPIAGGYIAQYANWRWTFWSIVIFNIVIQILAFFFLSETYAPRILGLKARALRASTGDPSYQTEFEMQHRTLPALLKVSLSRPWVMLGTQPIIQALALYQAFNYGMMYLIISDYPNLWTKSYGESKGTASLNYISLAVGSLIGVNICGPLTDWVYARQKRRHGIAEGDPGLPEFRIPLMIPAAIITPCGIALFAWTAQYKAHFILPNLGVAIMAGSSMISYQCIGAYIADCYSHYTASASAACCFLRSLGAFAFPLFAPSLFGALGYGWGGMVLVLVAVVIGVPAPLLLWKFGAKLRSYSRFSVVKD